MYKKRFIALMAFLSLTAASAFCVSADDRNLSVEKGKLAFDKPEALEHTVNLSGEWEFYYDKTPGQVSFMLAAKEQPDALVEVPGYWNETVKKITGEDKPLSKGTYRMIVTNLIPGEQYSLLLKECPPTSCVILVNGKFVASSGDPLHDKKDGFLVSHSNVSPLVGSFYPKLDGSAEIEVFINNYYYRKSGLMDTIVMGKQEEVFEFNNLLAAFSIFVSGLLLFLGVLNMIQYFINRERKEYFFMGLITLGFSIRVATAGYCSLNVLFPGLPAEAKHRLEYVAIWLTPPCVLAMMHILYPPRKEKAFGVMKVRTFQIIVNLVPLVVGALTIILPMKIANKLVPVMEVICGIFIFYGLFFMIENIIRKSHHIWFYFSSLVTLVVGLLLDVLYMKVKGVLPISIFPFFLVAYSFIQIALQATIQREAYTDTIVGSNKLKKVNDNYKRFVPVDTLKLINEESQLGIRRGDSINSEMSIGYTKFEISKNMSSDFEGTVFTEETRIKTFSELMLIINPIVKKHEGVVTTCAGTAFFAVFPDSPNEAILASLEIDEKLKTELPKFFEKGIIINHHTGLHYGSMVVGAVGEEQNVTATIISPAVNVVTKVEESCELKDKQIVVSLPFKDHLLMNRLKGVCLVELENVNVKGFLHPLELFDCIFINGGDLDL